MNGSKIRQKIYTQDFIQEYNKKGIEFHQIFSWFRIVRLSNVKVEICFSLDRILYMKVF